MISFSEIEVNTTERTEAMDITSRVLEKLDSSGISNGIILVHTIHTTTVPVPMSIPDLVTWFTKWMDTSIMASRFSMM